MPEGEWRDVISGAVVTSSADAGLRLADLLADLPVALLVATGPTDEEGTS